MNARAAMLALALAGLAAAQTPAPPTPAALARRLLDPNERTAASVALLRLGAPAAEALAGLLADEQVGAEGEALAARQAACEVLCALGPDAAPAIDSVLDCLKRKDHQGLRGLMLQAIGNCIPWHPDRIATVAKAVGAAAEDHSFLSDDLFRALTRLQCDPTKPIPKLVEDLQNAGPFARAFAAEALARRLRDGATPGERSAAQKALREAVNGDHPSDFKLNWDWNGSQASTSGSCSESDAIRAAAARALAVLDPTDPDARLGYGAQLRHLDPRRRQEAARGLGLLGKAGAASAGALMHALDDAELAVAREAATALGMLGEGSDEVRAALRRASGSTDKQLAARATAALRQLGS